MLWSSVAIVVFFRIAQGWREDPAPVSSGEPRTSWTRIDVRKQDRQLRCLPTCLAALRPWASLEGMIPRHSHVTDKIDTPPQSFIKSELIPTSQELEAKTCFPTVP